MRRIRVPSPATVLAAIALFVALGGTAVAAGVVPRAKFALNAGKLQGKTAAEVSALPGPASSVADLVAVKTASFTLAANDANAFGVTCDSGEKVVSGGFTSQGTVLGADTAPTTDGTGWQVVL